MTKRAASFIFLIFAAVLVVAAPALGQVFEKGAIQGTVYDPTGAVVPGATVRITNPATGLAREVQTNREGRYTAPLLPAGRYRIEISAQGFRTAIVREVNVAVGQEVVQDFTLQVGARGEEVVVEAQTGPVDATEPLEKVVIDDTYVERLPISGRDFRDFVALSATADQTPGLRSPIRLGGQFGEYTGLVIDGVDNRNSFFGEWFGSLETKNFTFPQDAVQEFQVRDTGFSAEFGHATGGLINVVTKSGTNEWHGSLHWFFQSDDTVGSTTTPARPEITIRPPFNTRHQFGGTVGGPLVRDKAFIFFAMDNQQQKGALPAFFAANVNAAPCPCPIPDELGGGFLSDLEGGGSQKQDLWAPLIRFDLNLNPNHTATTRINYTRNETINFTGGRGQLFVTGAVENNFEDFVNEGFVISQALTSVLGVRSVNEFRFAVSREKRPRRQKGPAPETCVVPGSDCFGRRFFLPIDSDHKRYQFIDNFSHTFGKHDLKFGVDINSNANSQVFIGFAGGQYNFFGLDSFNNRTPLFLLQLVGINGFDAIESGSLSTYWQHETSFYLQDNWRIHPRLTLNLGLRYDNVLNPDPEFPIVGDLVPVGRPQRNDDGSVTLNLATPPQGIPDDWNNWAPRIGVAWDVTGNGNNIVRGGVGVYYAPLPSIFMAETLAGQGFRGALLFIPFFGSSTDLLGLGLTYPETLPPAIPPGSPLEALLPLPLIRYADPDFESARVTNVQIGFERAITDDLSISGTYTYNRGDNLRIGGFWNSRYDRNIGCLVVSGCVISGNTLTIPASEFDANGAAISPYDVFTPFTPGAARETIDPTIGVADALTSFGKNRYHAFILQVRKVYSHRHQFGVNYTISRNSDNVSNDRDTDAYFAPRNPFDPDFDFGRSQLDIRHQFSAYGYFLLPAEIEVSTIFTARSGRAYPAYVSRCGAEPPGVSPITRLDDCSGIAFNHFPVVLDGELQSRYPFRNGDLFNWDLGFGREFPIATERTRLRVSFEIFNVTDSQNFFTDPLAGNNAVLFDPTGAPNPTFQQLDRTTGSIGTQFGLKLLF